VSEKKKKVKIFEGMACSRNSAAKWFFHMETLKEHTTGPQKWQKNRIWDPKNQNRLAC